MIEAPVEHRLSDLTLEQLTEELQALRLRRTLAGERRRVSRAATAAAPKGRPRKQRTRIETLDDPFFAELFAAADEAAGDNEDEENDE